MKKLKDVDYEILLELMKNSKTSDRQLAKKIGVSQPTVTRRRTMLEKEGLMEYTAIPNLKKLGFEIMAFSFSQWTRKTLTDSLGTEEFAKQIQTFLSKHPNVVFATSWGIGMGAMDAASISFHKDYTDYDKFVERIRREWGEHVSKFDQFIINLSDKDIVRQITFRHLGEYINQKR